MNKKLGKLIAGAAAVGAVTSAAVYGISRFLTDIAIKRKMIDFPESMQDKITGGMSKDPYMQKMKDASEKAKSVETEDISITSHDGLTLHGHYIPAENPKRLVIAMHGWRSTWHGDYGASGKMLHDQGCSVLYPTQRSTGESEGEYIGFGVLERFDCLDWINYAVERFGDSLPIYLMGVSMGSTTVLMTLGFSLPSVVHGCIADCGFTSPHAIWSHILANRLHIAEWITYPVVKRIINKEARYDGDDYSTLTALKGNTVPVLFIHGGNDGFVPIHMTFENYEECTAEKRLLVVPGAGHGMSYITNPAEYTEYVTDFFDKFDSIPSSPKEISEESPEESAEK